jgi:hypothetical protein
MSNVRDAFAERVPDHERRVLLEMDGQIVDVYDPLPSGYTYKLSKVSSASNARVVLLIVKEERVR